MIAMVRVLTGSPLSWCAPFGRGGFDAHHRGATRQERGKERFRRHLSSDPAPAAHKVVLEMRILVVEDERTPASFIERGLRAEGHAVTGR